MNEKLKINIIQGKYKDAEKICLNLDMSIINNTIMTIAYDIESICIYSFVQYMIQTTKKIEWIKLAINIMLNPLCFIEGAYSTALFHSRQLLEYNNNVENLERILFFYNIPENLIDKKEAKNIAEEILSIESDNKVALEIKKKL